MFSKIKNKEFFYIFCFHGNKRNHHFFLNIYLIKVINIQVVKSSSENQLRMEFGGNIFLNTSVWADSSQNLFYKHIGSIVHKLNHSASFFKTFFFYFWGLWHCCPAKIKFLDLHQEKVTLNFKCIAVKNTYFDQLNFFCEKS